MKRIQDDFKLKDDKMEPPDVHLGASTSKMNLASGETCWTIMSPKLHVKAAVANVEEDLAKNGRRSPSKCVTPFSSNYAPWLEDTAELKADGVRRFRELIGQLSRNSSDSFAGPQRSDALTSFWRRRCFRAILQCPESGISSRRFTCLVI
jgi:hypothetical protein